MKALSGTGVEPPVPVLLELPLEPVPPLAVVVRELDALPDDADPDDPDDPDNTLALPVLVEAEESAEVELAPDLEVVLLARLSTDGVLLRDEPLVLVAGVNIEVAAAAPEPAPEDEPAVLEATVATVPVVEPWIYRSCRSPGSRWNLGSVSRIT
jgi:hypothetical protein